LLLPLVAAGTAVPPAAGSPGRYTPYACGGKSARARHEPGCRGCLHGGGRGRSV